MATAVDWIRRHPGILILLVALVIGQLVQIFSRPYVEAPVRAGQFPVVAASVLAVALLLAIVVIVLRVRLGNQMLSGVRASSLSLPAPESLPARYAITDPQRRAVAGTLALIDVALLLLLQSTLRTPVLSIADDYVDRARANAVYVVLIVLVSLILLVKLYRTGGPVLVLMLWWGLDRLVPTAGFLGAHPSTPAVAASPSRPVLPPARTDTSNEPTERTPATRGAVDAEPTEVSAHGGTYEPTVRSGDMGRYESGATIVAPLAGLDATVVRTEAPRDPRQDMTIIAPLAPHAAPPAHDAEPQPEPDTRREGTVIVPPPDPPTPNPDSPTIVTRPHPDTDKP
jgi:hypothetical protein